MQQCPACNYELTMAEQIPAPDKCPKCDVYFAKYQVRVEREAAARKAEAEKKAAAERKRAQVKAKEKPLSLEQRLGGRLYCTHCGTVSNGTRHVPGSIGIELLLWLFFLIPGLIYSVWRHAAQHKACPACRHDSLVPVTSPRATKELSDS